MLKFQDKVALVTGSGTGIGQAIAKKFIENGASVVILGRRREPLEETAKMLEEIISKVQSGATVKIFSGVDVSDEKSVNEMFDSIRNSNMKVNFVINNAGVSGPVTCFVNASMNDFKSAVQIHLTGTFWTSVQALKVMDENSKIITISTFFTEERPLEQRPYRFRTPYTAAQGAKNRLAEAMGWELAEKKIISIATNPGPVHSDRIYKTVYPKAAAEFLRVSGFEELAPKDVEAANKEILPLLGEDEKTVNDGISSAVNKLSKELGMEEKKLEKTLRNLMEKVQTIAEKVQKNTSKMITDGQFLSQEQVATSVLNLCDEEISKILNGKVIPGDRVFYPVKPHISGQSPSSHQLDLTDQVVIFTIDATNDKDAKRAQFLAEQVEKNGGKTVCIISNKTSKEIQDSISSKFHSHVADLGNSDEIDRWFNAAKSMGKISSLVHITGDIPSVSNLTELSRSEWDKLVDKFINNPANIIQRILGQFVSGGSNDPRLFNDASGLITIIGPDLPVGRKIPGSERAKVDVFRGALRPFIATLNQELSDVLKSRIRTFLVLPGSVDGSEPKGENISRAFNYFLTENSISSSEVVFCVDETR